MVRGKKNNARVFGIQWYGLALWLLRNNIILNSCNFDFIAIIDFIKVRCWCWIVAKHGCYDLLFSD